MAVTITDLRVLLNQANDQRKAAGLGEMIMINSLEPAGIAFLEGCGNGTMKQVHSEPLEKRTEAACFLVGQLAVLSALGS